MLIKKFFCVLMLINCSLFAFSQVYSFYDEFIRINNILGNQQYLASQKLIITENNKIIEEKTAISIFSGESQVTSVSNSYFLSTPHGYWMFNKKLKSPLKISGNFQIEDFDIQDILRIDYKNNYRQVSTENAQEFLFERVSKKMTYPYISIRQPSSKQYETTFMDKNKKPIKTLIYTAGYINNTEYFSNIEIHNHLFNASTTRRYITVSLSKIKIPTILFSSTQLEKLIPYIIEE
ncbi:MAG: hypothetical protein ACTTJ7_00260 [Treponema sp.]